MMPPLPRATVGPAPARSIPPALTRIALALAACVIPVAPARLSAQLPVPAASADRATCVALGTTRLAVDACRAAAAAIPADVGLRVRLADALAGNGRDLDALQAYHEAMRLAPDSAAAWFGAARVLDGRGDRRGALDYYRTFARLTPRDAEGPEIIGWLLLELGEPSGALDAFREASAREPASASGAYGAGLALAALARPAEAQTALERAVRLAPGNAGAWGALGRVAASAGREQDAVAYWERAVTIDGAYFEGRREERRQWQGMARRTGPQAPAALPAQSLAGRTPAVPGVVQGPRLRPAAFVSSGSTGTGFVVGARGWVLTNRHVVRGCQAVRVRPDGGVARPATVFALDPDDDLALLRTDTTFAAVAAFRGGREPRAGEEVVAVGYPLNGLLADQAHVTVGSISALAGLYNDLHELTISTPVQMGNSGGPLLDAYGNVVGVVVMKLNARAVQESTGDLPQNVNFAIKGSVVREFLTEQGIVPLTGLPGRTLSNADVGDVGRGVALLVECAK